MNSKTPTATPTPCVPTLWLIDDDPALRLILEDNFSSAEINGQPINVVSFTNAHGAWVQLNEIKNQQSSQTTTANSSQNTSQNTPPHAIITDIRMPMMDGLSFSEWLGKEFPDISIIIMTAHSDLQSAIDSYQTGAFEYLPKPFDLDEAVTVVQKAINRNVHYQQQLASTKLTNKLANNVNDKSNNKMVSKETINEPQIGNTINNPISNQKISTKKTPTNPQKPLSKKQPNKEQLHKEPPHQGIIGQSVAMQNVFRAVGRLAHSPITVLVTGESGTGKELIANALHQTSSRREQPFIALNMSAIPHDLIESELFGHEKGAFTGATSSRKGRFEQADGGTLFLDEIGDMPFNTQTRLLRVLANGEFFRVGGKDPIKVDVRIISATHQNLEHLVKQGKFREDLFYRLNVIRLPLPPLRDRAEDIPALTEFFLQKSATELNSELKKVHPTAMQVLQNHHWSGNVRQLENTCRWLTVMTSGDTVYQDDLPPELLNESNGSDRIPTIEKNIEQSIDNNNTSKESTTKEIADTKTATPKETPSWQQLLEVWTAEQIQHIKNANSDIGTDIDNNTNSEHELLNMALPEFEKVLINTTLLHCKGHKGKASKMLGWGRNTLARKIKQLGLDDRW